jgi:phosphate transport system permease protein
MTTTDFPSLADAPARPLARKKGRPAETIFHAAVLGSVIITLAFLAWLIISVVIESSGQLDWNFLTDKASQRSPERAGFTNALRGSLVLMMITAAVAIPLGFAAAIYLEKFAPLSRDALVGVAKRRERAVRVRTERGELSGMRLGLSRFWVRVSYLWSRIGPPINAVVEVNISNLAAVPSIIYGVLGLALFVSIMGLSKSLLAGGLTLAVLVLPIIIIASREAIRSVPSSIEQGAVALGATRWQAVRKQVLPAAIPGMLTGSILAMSRAIGETAPLVVVGGIAFGTAIPSLNPLVANEQPLFAMPLQIFNWATQSREEFHQLAAAGILVLMGTLVVLNLTAIIIRNRFTRRW